MAGSTGRSSRPGPRRGPDPDKRLRAKVKGRDHIADAQILYLDIPVRGRDQPACRETDHPSIAEIQWIGGDRLAIRAKGLQAAHLGQRTIGNVCMQPVDRLKIGISGVGRVPCRHGRRIALGGQVDEIIVGLIGGAAPLYAGGGVDIGDDVAAHFHHEDIRTGPVTLKLCSMPLTAPEPPSISVAVFVVLPVAREVFSL